VPRFVASALGGRDLVEKYRQFGFLPRVIESAEYSTDEAPDGGIPMPGLDKSRWGGKPQRVAQAGRDQKAS
jgi:hypothetical protein